MANAARGVQSGLENRVNRSPTPHIRLVLFLHVTAWHCHICKQMIHLRHLALQPLTSYSHAAALQHRFVSAFLAHKANPSSTTLPDPVILTAQFHPTYTCGRREVGNVTREQIQYLTAETQWGRAEFHEAMRGGQTTFHGPGQLVAYPILDLKRHGITPRDWIHLLEGSVMATCAHYGVETKRTENPGVWASEDQKICALGVHLRRNVTSHGIGLNVNVQLGWFGRIVGCGLEGKTATDLRTEMEGKEVPEVEEVADVFVRRLSEGLEGIGEVRKMTQEEVS